MTLNMNARNFILSLFWLCLDRFMQETTCNPVNQTSGCRHFSNNNQYICSGTLPTLENAPDLLLGEISNISILELYNIREQALNLSEITYLSNVSNFTVWEGNVTKITGTFLPNNTIKVLQLRNLSLEELPKFDNSLSFLEVLDLRGNKLKTLDENFLEFLNQIPEAYLMNNHWNCSLSLDWALKLNQSTVQDIDDMKCYEQPYPGKPLLPIARFIYDVQKNCPEECECSMPDVVRDPSSLQLEPIIEVNCSDRGLTEMPPILPEKTKILMLERNSISSLEPLIINPIYRGVQDLYLDSNFIDSIEELEGIYWFSHFRVLSLSNNKLSQLPTYALDNALQHNPNMPIAVRIYLGNNPWRCDCVFTPGFQDMLRKYEMQIRDIDDIRCSYVEYDENSFTLILELSRSSVCHLPNEYSVRVLDMLNGILATLIVLILGKLAYDYYHFKRTGRLPWIVTKMP